MEVELRDITSDKIFGERSIFRLVNDSNLQRKRKRRKKDMSDDERVRDFQRKLYRKAKQDKSFRFYVLYDKVRIMYFLREAYRRVKKNKGQAGIDGITFQDIESRDLTEYLSEIQKELENESYRPSPVLRVKIPKADGGERPLGIPTIKDRIVQMSCKMVIEPIFEADFEDCSYGFRPKRSAQDAVIKIKEYIKEGNTEILDADLEKFFDNIPHEKLMIVLAQRVSDRKVLHLIKMWLKSTVVENDRYTGGKKSKKGTPQGSVISPLLANVYIHLLDRIINKANEIFKKYGIKIVRYADDFILMGKKIPKEVIIRLTKFLKRLGLKLNEKKTEKLNIRDKSFNFLGFTFRYDKDKFGKNKKYLNIIPCKKSCKNIRAEISIYSRKSWHYDRTDFVDGLNAKIRGWLNYFIIPNVSYPYEAKRKLRYYIFKKLYRYFKRKSQRKCKLYNRGVFNKLVNAYGLIDPMKYNCSLTPVKV